MLDVGLRRISTVLDEPGTRKQLATVIIEVSRREYPKLIKMLGLVMDTDEFGLRVSGTLVESMQGWLHDIGQNPTHPRRKQFDDLATRFIDKLKNDPEYHAKIEEWKKEFLGTPVVADYFETLWVHFRKWLLKDIQSNDSQMRHRLSRTFPALRTLGAGKPVPHRIDQRPDGFDHLRHVCRNPRNGIATYRLYRHALG